MQENSYYGQEAHGPYELVDIGDFEMTDGGVLSACQIAIATHGQLNQDRSNAILVPTWYSGTSKIIEQVLIGSGRALDPDRYFIIVANQIGSGLSTSPHNASGEQVAAAFPKVRISDDVRAQRKLLADRFGIEKLALVVGGSMGAQQCYEWAVLFPDQVERVAAIAATARSNEATIQIAKALTEALTSDPGFSGGSYASSEDVAAGLARHARLWTLFGWSDEFFRQQRYRALGFDTLAEFVDNFMTPYFAPMDPNNLLAMAWKWQNSDPGLDSGGDLAAALGRIAAKTFVMPISHDRVFPPADAAADQALIPGSELRTLDSIDGHFALLGTDSGMLAQLDAHLRELLGR